MRSFKKLSNRCIKGLEPLNIPLGNIRKIEYAGLGRYLRNCIAYCEGVFDIQISDLFKSDEVDILGLKAIIMHGLLHTIMRFWDSKPESKYS